MLSKADCPLQCDWDSFSQLKALREKRLKFPRKEGIFVSRGLYCNINSSLGLWTAGLFYRFWTYQAFTIM